MLEQGSPTSTSSLTTQFGRSLIHLQHRSRSADRAHSCGSVRHRRCTADIAGKPIRPYTGPVNQSARGAATRIHAVAHRVKRCQFGLCCERPDKFRICQNCSVTSAHAALGPLSVVRQRRQTAGRTLILRQVTMLYAGQLRYRGSDVISMDDIAKSTHTAQESLRTRSTTHACATAHMGLRD